MGFITFIIIPFLILGYLLQILMTLTRLNTNEFKQLSEFLINLIPFPILFPWWTYKGIKMTIDNIKELSIKNKSSKEVESKINFSPFLEKYNLK